ncbi:MAG: hypothetical protein ACLS5C_06305 [Waltera sp.]
MKAGAVVELHISLAVLAIYANGIMFLLLALFERIQCSEQLQP